MDKIKEFLERAGQLEASDSERRRKLSASGIADLTRISGADYEQWINEIKVFCKTELSSHPLCEDLLVALQKRNFSAIRGCLQAINSIEISALSTKEPLVTSGSKIFIVHGHDLVVKTEAARFCEKIGLSPIILNDQPSKGKTIIEKIEDYSDVGFALVLYTPCDVGKENSDSTTYHARARQNVVFEHGYLIAKLGRNKVCALVKDSVETPSDISGVIYIPIDNAGAWQYKVIDELKAAGFSVSKDSI